jgi:hypothetical protein
MKDPGTGTELPTVPTQMPPAGFYEA